MLAAKKKGVHITHYINARLVNVKLMTEDLADACIVNRQGECEKERYGNENLAFYTMCPMSRAWQEKLADFGQDLCGRYGFSGFYLDVFATSPHSCYNAKHGHCPDEWREGYQRILRELYIACAGQDREEPCLMHEWAADVYGPLSCGQLVQTFGRVHTGAFPEMYRYTFPEHLLVDMLYPEKNMAMRPVHIGKISEKLMQQAFTLGFYFWIYDLEEDNTFERDPEKLLLLKRTIAARNYWLKHYGAGKFADEKGIAALSPGVHAKVYETERGGLVAFFNDTEGDFTVTSEREVSVSEAISVGADARVTEADYRADNRKITVRNAKIGLIVFKEK